MDSTSQVAPFRATLSRLAPLAIPLLAVVWAAHVTSTQLQDPWGLPFDWALVITATLLKPLAWTGLVLLLVRVHAQVSQDRRRAVISFGCWFGVLAATLVLMASTRDGWAPVLSSHVTRYYFDGDNIVGPQSVIEHRNAWTEHWRAGHVLAAELALVALFAAIHASVAYRFGARKVRSFWLAFALTELLLIGYVAWSPWILLDYDFFHGDVLLGAVLLDQIPLAADPYTTLGVVAYCALGAACQLSSWANTRFAGRSASSRAPL